MNHFRHIAAAAVGGAMLTAICAFSAPAFAAGPEVVAGPASEPGCFVPWGEKTKFFKYPAKKAPSASRSPTASSPIRGASR